MGWRDDLRTRIEERANEHWDQLPTDIPCCIKVSASVFEQLVPALGKVNERELAGWGEHFVRLIWMDSVSSTVEFSFRVITPWTKVRLTFAIGSPEFLADLLDHEGNPLYPYFDFDQVKDSWRDLPPLM